MTFEVRDLQFVITLGAGAFGEQVGDTVELGGLRSTVNIEQWGGETMGMCYVRIFGVPLDLMNRMTSIGPVMTQVAGKNSIEVMMGDTTIFLGTIWQCWPEFEAAPEVCIVIHAQSALINALKPDDGISYKGGKDVADILKRLSENGGLAFENNGVSVQLVDQVLTGSLLDKVKTVCRAANINYVIENGTLAIWPKSSYRDLPVINISPESGMVGYPTFNESYMAIRHEFLPQAQVGGRFTLSGSVITPANTSKPWNIAAVTHTLETISPHGAWFTDIQGFGMH